MFNSNHSMILSIVIAVSTTTLARCDDTSAIDSSTSNWKVEFEPVPEILRWHCAALQSGQGLVVKRVHEDFNAPYRLLAGDVLLSVSGIPIRSINDLPGTPISQLPLTAVVMRRGQIKTLGQSRPIVGWPRNNARFPGPAMMQDLAKVGVYASASAGGNESVSVSQNGDQISIDMSLPQLHAGNIRYRGTRDQIQREVESSNLPPAAIQRVLDAIR